jgi:hypothetical protein
LSNIPPLYESGVPGFTVSSDGGKLLVGQTKCRESGFYTASLEK